MIRQRCSLNVQACFGGGSVRRVWVSCTKNANIELVPGSSGLTSESFETGHSSELNISELSCRGLPFLLSSTYFARTICTPSFLILHVIQKFTPTDKAWCQALPVPGARPIDCAAHLFWQYRQFAALTILTDLVVTERTQGCIKRPRYRATPNKSTKDRWTSLHPLETQTSSGAKLSGIVGSALQ